MTLSEYLIEAVAKRKTGKYGDVNEEDIIVGAKFRIKEQLGNKKIVAGMDISGYTMYPEMINCLGEIVTVTDVKPSSVKVVCDKTKARWYFPIEMLEYI